MKNQSNFSEILLSDEKIIDLYWERNERAISETDKKYGRYLFTIAYNIVHDELDCEECLNDTYLGTWNRIPPTKPTAFQIFISKIMRNTAVDKYRKNRAAKNIPSELTVSLHELDECLSASPSAEEEYSIQRLSQIISSFIRGQSERNEFVFVCRYYYSDYIADIAKMLDVSEKTVSRALASMRGELKELLEKEGYLQ